MRHLFQSSIGKKAVMSITGIILTGFVIGHLAGNLQIYIPDGGKKLNEYAAMLKANAAVLWGVRLVLLFTVLAHIATAVTLALENRAARPVPYAHRKWREASYASRTMIMSGPIVGAFVVYHLLHFTIGSAHPSFSHTDVHANVIAGFSVPWVAGVYILAMLLLGLHLYHGFWSMFQSLGINHPKYNRFLRTSAALVAAGIALGNISIPVAVMAGIVK